MAHEPRLILEECTLVEVTTRTFQGRYFLLPTPQVREIILGVLGRAQRMYGMRVCLVAFASNHYHLLLRPTDAKQLSAFMNYVNGEIARKIMPLIPWSSKFWNEPFKTVLVTNEPAAQRARFAYLSSHGVKEHLVERPEQWIGVNGVKAWLEGERLQGHWFDKTGEYRAKKLKKNEGRVLDRERFTKLEELFLTEMPCWEGLSPEEIRAEIREMVEEIVKLALLERTLAGRPKVMGVEAVLAMPRDHRPKELKKSPRPRFHFRSREVYERWRAAYGEVLADYRRASAEYREGKQGVRFPEGCFPPARPFTFDGWVDGRPGEGPPEGVREAETQ